MTYDMPHAKLDPTFWLPSPRLSKLRNAPPSHGSTLNFYLLLLHCKFGYNQCQRPSMCVLSTSIFFPLLSIVIQRTASSPASPPPIPIRRIKPNQAKRRASQYLIQPGKVMSHERQQQLVKRPGPTFIYGGTSPLKATATMP